MKKKVEISYFTIQKFLPPSLVFYPTFVISKVEHIWVVNMKSEQTSRLKKWGKKLVRGVKNFWIFSISISAFICTKNYQKIFKTRECTSICANVYICAKSGKEKSFPFKSLNSFLVTSKPKPALSFFFKNPKLSR